MAEDDTPSGVPEEARSVGSGEPRVEDLPDEPNAAPLTKTSTTNSRRKGLEERAKSKIALIMGALGMAVFLAALDATIISVALPSIAQDLEVSAAAYTWIGSAYTLGCAAATPPWGKISDIFGRKPILLIANIVFFVGSLICALSVNIDMLIAGRAIQGIGGGGLLSLVNICIADLVSMRNRGAYYGIIGAVWALAGALGPVLGGVFTSYATWRWCFYVNLPCDGVAFIILFFFLDIETPRTPILDGLRAIDWTGTLLIVGGVVAFLIGLETGGVTLPWNSAEVICLLVFGIVILALFLVLEWRFAKYPVMPLRLFQNRNTVAAYAVCFCHGMVFIAGSYFLPVYFQAVLGSSPLLSGVDLLPFVGGLGVTSLTVGIFIRKTGLYREPIWFGMSMMTLGFGLFIDLPVTSYWGKIAPYLVIAGLGSGPNFQAPMIALQNHVAGKDMAAATATFAFVRNIATSIGLVVGGVIFQNQVASQVDTLLTVLDPGTAEYLATGSAGASVGLVKNLPEQARKVVQQVYTSSLSVMWIFFTCIAGCGFVIALLIQKKELSREHEVRKQGLEQQEADRQEELAAKQEKKAAADPA